MITGTIIEVVVAQSIGDTIRIGRTNEAVVARGSGWVVWDAFRFPFRLVIPMVTCAIVEGVVTPTVWETVRVGGTNIVIIARQKRTSILSIDQRKVA
jgi:hypothetical protein